MILEKGIVRAQRIPVKNIGLLPVTYWLPSRPCTQGLLGSNPGGNSGATLTFHSHSRLKMFVELFDLR